jgi:hypothetical protein
VPVRHRSQRAGTLRREISVDDRPRGRGGRVRGCVGAEQGLEQLGLTSVGERELVGGGQRAQWPAGESRRDPAESVRVDLELGGQVRPAAARQLAADGPKEQQPVEHVLQPQRGRGGESQPPVPPQGAAVARQSGGELADRAQWGIRPTGVDDRTAEQAVRRDGPAHGRGQVLQEELCVSPAYCGPKTALQVREPNYIFDRHPPQRERVVRVLARDHYDRMQRITEPQVAEPGLVGCSPEPTDDDHHAGGRRDGLFEALPRVHQQRGLVLGHGGCHPGRVRALVGEYCQHRASGLIRPVLRNSCLD